MIIKGILKTIDYNNNSCTVRLPLFETTNNSGEVVLPAIFMNQPGMFNGYNEGDIVFVDFENNKLEAPIIIGKLYLGSEKEASNSQKGGLKIASLTVDSSATLPLDTKLVFNHTSSDAPVDKGLSSYKSIIDIIKAIHTTETTLEKVTDTQNSTNDSFIQRIEVTYLSQLAELEAPLSTNEGWSLVIPASRDGYKIWQKTTTYNNKGQILGTPEIICISDLTGTASYWLKCSTKNHAGNQQSPTEAVEITAMIKLGLNIETEDTDATLYYKWSGEEEISANSNKIVLTNNGDFKNKNLIIRAERNGITYLTETILYTPLNTPILRFSKETDSLSYDSYGYNKLNTNDTASVAATVLLNNEIIPATYTWLLEDCTNIAQRPAEPSWDPIKVSGSSITIYHIAETAEQATATCNAVYTDPAGNQQTLTKVFSISKNRQGKSLYKIDILNEFSTILLSYDDKYEDANLTFTEHTVSAFYGDDVLTFTVGNTPNTNSDNKSYYLYIKQTSGLTLNKVANQQTSAFTTKVNTITADAGEVIYELYRGSTKVASAKFELSVLRSGTPATNLWLVISHPVHTGSQHSTPITVQPKIQIGNTGIDNNTESYVGYKYESDETYTKLVWNSDRELFEIPLPYRAENIKIIASQNEDLSDSYEEEEITYSPLNTPVINLTNDSDDLVYTPNGTKIDDDEIATSIASLWLNGEKIKSDITFKWLLDGCVIQGQEDSETPDSEISGKPTDGDYSIIISKLTKAKATATCIATYKGQEYKKVFSIAKQIQGDASTSYWLKTSTKIHTGATSLDNIEIIAMRKEGTSAETPDTTAHLWYKFKSEQTWRKESDGSTHLININKTDLKDEDLIIAATHNNSNSAPLDVDIYDQETITYSPKNTPVIDLTNDSDILPYDADGFIIGNPLAQTTAELYLNGEKINETNLSFSWVDASNNKNVITFEGETNKPTIKIKAISENTATATCNITIAANGINGQFANKTYSKDFKIVRQIKGDPTTIYKIAPSTATVTYTKAKTYIPASIEFNILESRGIKEPTIVDFETVAGLELITNQDGLEFTKTNSTYSLSSSNIIWPLEVSLIKDNVLIHKETINKVTDGTDGADGQDGQDATSYWLKGVEAVHLGSKQATNINIVAVKQTGLNGIEEDKDAILWWTFDGKDSWESPTSNKHILQFTAGPGYALANNKDITILATHNSDFKPDTSTTVSNPNIYEWETITYSPLNTPVLDLSNDSASLNYTSEGTKIDTADKVSSTATLYLNGEAITTASYIWYLENCTTDITATTNNTHLVTDTISINSLTANNGTATCLAFKDKDIKAVVIRSGWSEESWARYSTDTDETWTGSTAITIGEYFVIVGRATDSKKFHVILGQATSSNNGEISGGAVSYDEAFTKVFSISKQLIGDTTSTRVENAFYATTTYDKTPTPTTPGESTEAVLTEDKWAILSDYPTEAKMTKYKLVFHSSRTIYWNETTDSMIGTPQAWSLPVVYWCKDPEAYRILTTAKGLFGYGQGVYYTVKETKEFNNKTFTAGTKYTPEELAAYAAESKENKDNIEVYIDAAYIKTGALTVGIDKDGNGTLDTPTELFFQAGLDGDKANPVVKIGGFNVSADQLWNTGAETNVGLIKLSSNVDTTINELEIDSVLSLDTKLNNSTKFPNATNFSTANLAAANTIEVNLKNEKSTTSTKLKRPNLVYAVAELKIDQDFDELKLDYSISRSGSFPDQPLCYRSTESPYNYDDNNNDYIFVCRTDRPIEEIPEITNIYDIIIDTNNKESNNVLDEHWNASLGKLSGIMKSTHSGSIWLDSLITKEYIYIFAICRSFTNGKIEGAGDTAYTTSGTFYNGAPTFRITLPGTVNKSQDVINVSNKFKVKPDGKTIITNGTVSGKLTLTDDSSIGPFHIKSGGSVLTNTDESIAFSSYKLKIANNGKSRLVMGTALDPNGNSVDDFILRTKSTYEGDKNSYTRKDVENYITVTNGLSIAPTNNIINDSTPIGGFEIPRTTFGDALSSGDITGNISIQNSTSSGTPTITNTLSWENKNNSTPATDIIIKGTYTYTYVKTTWYYVKNALFSPIEATTDTVASNSNTSTVSKRTKLTTVTATGDLTITINTSNNISVRYSPLEWASASLCKNYKLKNITINNATFTTVNNTTDSYGNIRTSTISNIKVTKQFNTEEIDPNYPNHINSFGHFLPKLNNRLDLGSSTYKWNNIYANNIYANNIQYGVINVGKEWVTKSFDPNYEIVGATAVHYQNNTNSKPDRSGNIFVSWSGNYLYLYSCTENALSVSYIVFLKPKEN